MRFRRVAEFALDAADGDVRREWRRAIADAPGAAGAWRAARGAIDPRDRDRALDRVRGRRERADGFGADRRSARDAAARSIGARDAADLLEGGDVEDSLRTLDAFERGAIAPLDEILEARAADRARDVPGRGGGGPTAADEPWIEDLAAHASKIAPARVAPVLASLGAGLGFDPDAGRGPTVDPGLERTRSLEMDVPRPRVAIAAEDGGPAALVAALAAWGRGLRATVIRERRGDGPFWIADPALAVAAEVLFRRLALSRAFADHFGLDGYDLWRPDLIFEEAVRPRRDAAAARLAFDPADVAGARFEERMRRAAGRPPWPLRFEASSRTDPAGIHRLRGTVLGLLVEERLLTRHGTRWFRDRAAGRFLADAWEAEPDGTAESMAGEMGVGRMEPTPILDRCRPGAGSGAETR